MRALIFLCFLASAYGFFEVPDGIQRKFDKHKVFMTCFGDEAMGEYWKLMDATIDKCSKEFAQKKAEEFQNQAQTTEITESEQVQGVNDKGQNYINKLTAKAEIMGCLFRELNYTDENNQPIPETLLTMVENTNLSSSFKADFRELVQLCDDLAAFLPFERAKHPLVQRFGRATTFMYCIEKKEIMACMRQEFIKYAHWQGLDGNDEKIFELIMMYGDGKEETQYF
ncbi:uncharacterized protein LOC143018146 [Oratosquilla oratoria]|uniref:uncharacterized protein LOC143018146 n=1 Tax=Oratosquilla oratoria TaxID=337810 RepID=UPI003F758D0A